MKKRVLAVLTASVLAIGMLAACGGSAASSAASEAPAESSGGASANLTMGTGGESGTYYAFGGVLVS